MENDNENKQSKQCSTSDQSIGDESSSSSSFISTDDNKSSSHGSSSSSRQLSVEEREELAAKETKLVNRARIVVLAVLIILAIIAAVVSYLLAKQSEYSNFESQFGDFAVEIEAVAHHNAENVHSVLQSFTATISSYTLFSDIEWPFLTIPHFDQRAKRAVATAGAGFIAFSPFVLPQQQQDWNLHSASDAHQWIKSFSPKEEILEIPIIHPTLSVHAPFALPLWQMYPAPIDNDDDDGVAFVNYNLHEDPIFNRVATYMKETNEPVLTEVVDVRALFGPSVPDTQGHPQSLLVEPIFLGFQDGKESELAGLLVAAFPWDTFLSNLLHDGAGQVLAVLKDTCGDVFTYEINGSTANFLGYGDFHESKFDNLVVIADFDPLLGFSSARGSLDAEGMSASVNCHYEIWLYPTQALQGQYLSATPLYFTFSVVVVFAVSVCIFMIYDFSVKRRQTIVMQSAIRSNAIVSSLFPKDIRDRLFKGSAGKKSKKSSDMAAFEVTTPKLRLNTFLQEKEHDNNQNDDDADDDNVDVASSQLGRPLAPDGELSKPIADLFPNTTVLFADIVGFTAWSSVREPTQVFTLLETIYAAFDLIAKRRKVFKVETIGDCYVAVAGLPEPRLDHASVMCRFAKDCLKKFDGLSKQMEVTLGPDTGDLGMRFGLHSGPVTAGVLRGDKSRFQLFGDTVNTAARMESTGSKDRIQLSQATADLLVTEGKENWLQPREDLVVAKGKGELKTYWVKHKGFIAPVLADTKLSHATGNASDGTKEVTVQSPSQPLHRKTMPELSPKFQRLVGWNVDVLLSLLKQVVASRGGDTARFFLDRSVQRLERDISSKEPGVLDEVTEFVELPQFHGTAQRPNWTAAKKNTIDPEIVDKLRQYVTAIAFLYQENPFHNFEHASHCAMSVSKLLSRIVAPDNMDDRTYGITSDPMTQFAVVLSALIHDADHRGVPNFVLSNEKDQLAATYSGKCILEQNSVDKAWAILMHGQYDKLRACIYSTPDELKRFRQLLVNTVIATDIFDGELAAARKNRWERCFNEERGHKMDQWSQDDVNRKATIVIEHLIQASDVSHTMQHWQIYRKWNHRLFDEMYLAYQQGRINKDPSIKWYYSELGFFDNYVIPLAKKLKECGVFGVSSDEYLNYAIENRREWSVRGKDMVQEMLKNNH